MKTETAYAVARAVEIKLGIPISVQRYDGLIAWSNETYSCTVFANTDLPARAIAQKLVVDLKPPEVKKRKTHDD